MRLNPENRHARKNMANRIPKHQIEMINYSEYLYFPP